MFRQPPYHRSERAFPPFTSGEWSTKALADDMCIEGVLDIYPHPRHRLRCDVEDEDAAPSAPTRRPVFKQTIEIDDSQPELEVGQQDGKKRRRDEDDEVQILPEVKRLREELSSHPLYEENAAKVILISSDGQRFSVDTHTLSTFSSVFKDLLTLPSSDVSSTDQTAEMAMDVPANVLSRFIHGMYAARHHSEILPKPDLAILDANVKLHKKFSLTVTQDQAEEDLHVALKSDPFAGLAYASRQNDVELGREAIKLIEFDSGFENQFDLWDKISDMKLSWQVAFMRLALSPFGSQTGGLPIILRARCRLSMEEIAEQFDPKDTA